ncbi:DUF3040 domain-containing protein [Demequina mangrovi]|uniref:DUF3040 domain-containing protein n=1 Tax=Demequina mangrovi TaxID=1043493 RepID=A0A1H6Z101_9MICO|nr:DUF3040 domain-containing protein [Demequina mangrovi]SEJ47203.1 Protein of unknown function [Demequina mangrovi]
MPLSEYEQRVLEQLERDLGSDVKLGSAMARASRRRGRYVWAGVGVVAGLGIVVTGAVTQLVIVGVAGFAVMLAAAIWALLAPRSTVAASGPRPATGSQTGRRKADKGFMARMEERFERRREQGDI